MWLGLKLANLASSLKLAKFNSSPNSPPLEMYSRHSSTAHGIRIGGEGGD